MREKTLRGNRSEEGQVSGRIRKIQRARGAVMGSSDIFLLTQIFGSCSVNFFFDHSLISFIGASVLL